MEPLACSNQPISVPLVPESWRGHSKKLNTALANAETRSLVIPNMDRGEDLRKRIGKYLGSFDEYEVEPQLTDISEMCKIPEEERGTLQHDHTKVGLPELDAVNDGMNEFESYVHPDTYEDFKLTFDPNKKGSTVQFDKQLPRERSAYYSPGATLKDEPDPIRHPRIRLAEGAGTAIVLHELGHLLEAHNLDMKHGAHRILASRCYDENINNRKNANESELNNLFRQRRNYLADPSHTEDDKDYDALNVKIIEALRESTLLKGIRPYPFEGMPHAVYVEAEKLGEGYRNSEQYMRRQDGQEWLDNYMGKIYEDGGTELMSLGLEMLHTDPERLMEQDPGLFDYVIDHIRGHVARDNRS